MRRALLLLALMTGCAQPDSAHQNGQAAIAAVAQWRAAGEPPPNVMNQMADQAQRAAIICRARGNLAATQPAYGGPGLSGAIAGGMQQGWAAANAEAICLDTYRATGIMPSY